MASIALIIENVVINQWKLEKELIIFGRTKDCDIQIDEQSVSSKHARIVVQADPYMDDVRNYYLEDLNSTNGTEINGQKVSKQKLNDGDVIKIGFNEFRFTEQDANGLEETAVIIT